MKTDLKEATIDFFSEENAFLCRGAWTLPAMNHLAACIAKLPEPQGDTVIVDGKGIEAFDSAGAWHLLEFIASLKAQKKHVQLRGFSSQQESLLQLIEAKAEQIRQPLEALKTHNWFYRLGVTAHNKLRHIDAFIIFIGELTTSLLEIRRIPLGTKWRTFMTEIDNMGYRALPIVALLAFFIGIVLSYQMGLQLKHYGADIFIVRLSGMAILREFGPLMTAIIIAGRTSSAITAQIGTMILNEEVDALRTMGLSPMSRLVVPKVLGLLLVMPLMTFWADVFGVIGAMVMSKNMLSINYSDFLNRFQHVVEIKHYYIGLSKAPFFALIIATVGCFQGFRVAPNADSLGKQTTISVVQAIFLIIIADALFSILYSAHGG